LSRDGFVVIAVCVDVIGVELIVRHMSRHGEYRPTIKSATLAYDILSDAVQRQVPQGCTVRLVIKPNNF
jgi:hypothetical protein